MNKKNNSLKTVLLDKQKKIDTILTIFYMYTHNLHTCITTYFIHNPNNFFYSIYTTLFLFSVCEFYFILFVWTILNIFELIKNRTNLNHLIKSDRFKSKILLF